MSQLMQGQLNQTVSAVAIIANIAATARLACAVLQPEYLVELSRSLLACQSTLLTHASTDNQLPH
jgi:hypothetical protein